MAHATVTSKGQITIPRIVRQTLGLRTGSRVVFYIFNCRHVCMEPETASVRLLKGICKVTRQRRILVAQRRRTPGVSLLKA